MIYRTHLAFGTATLGSAVLFNLLPLPDYPAMAFFLIGCLLPDIDNPDSFIGRRCRIVSIAINKSFGHRGLTHLLIFPVILYVIVLLLIPQYHRFALFFSLGILLHQLGDLCTSGGIRIYFFPWCFFKSRYTVFLLPRGLRFRTGGKVESLLVFPFFLAVSVIVFWIIFSQ